MEELKTISSTIVPPRNFTLVDGLLKDTSGRIFVPSTSLQSKILHAAHDRNHLGSQATYTVIAPNFYWPGIHTYTKNFVRGCQVCPRIKSLPRNYGLLHPLPIPNSSWEDIGMDHIVGLPLSNGFDAILTVVDRFSKMAHFIPALYRLCRNLSVTIPPSHLSYPWSPTIHHLRQGRYLRG